MPYTSFTTMTVQMQVFVVSQLERSFSYLNNLFTLLSTVYPSALRHLVLRFRFAWGYMGDTPSGPKPFIDQFALAERGGVDFHALRHTLRRFSSLECLTIKASWKTMIYADVRWLVPPEKTYLDVEWLSQIMRKELSEWNSRGMLKVSHRSIVLQYWTTNVTTGVNEEARLSFELS